MEVIGDISSGWRAWITEQILSVGKSGDIAIPLQPPEVPQKPKT